MITKTQRLLVVIVAFLGTLSLSCANKTALAQSANVEAARKEGKIVVYGTIVPQIMSVIQKGFEEKYASRLNIGGLMRRK